MKTFSETHIQTLYKFVSLLKTYKFLLELAEPVFKQTPLFLQLETGLLFHLDDDFLLLLQSVRQLLLLLTCGLKLLLQPRTTKSTWDNHNIHLLQPRTTSSTWDNYNINLLQPKPTSSTFYTDNTNFQPKVQICTFATVTHNRHSASVSFNKDNVWQCTVL